MSDRNSERLETLGWLRWVIGASVFVAVVLITTALLWYRQAFPGAPSTSHEHWGQFGDYVGGVINPTLSFLSLIALLLALVLQARELRLSTKELARSAEALSNQHSVLLLQNFENTFFNLLSRFDELVSHVRYGAHTDVEGRKALATIYSTLDGHYRKAGRPSKGVDGVAEAYDDFYKQWHHELGHYFRSLYHIFKFVDRSPLSESEKVMYANIARAQLSSVELCLLFYNGVSAEGRAGFRPLIERFGLLKHINRADLLEFSHDQLNIFGTNAYLGYEDRAFDPSSRAGIGGAVFKERRIDAPRPSTRD